MGQLIPIQLVREAHENASACSNCKGLCCQTLPGEILPSDLGDDLNPAQMYARIREMLQSGNYSVDWWDCPPFSKEDLHEVDRHTPGYFLRPATVRGKGQWFDASWGGTCTFHTASGCALEAQHRPSGCLSLVPRIEQDGSPSCYSAEGWDGKLTAAKAWWPYRGVFLRLRRERQALAA